MKIETDLMINTPVAPRILIINTPGLYNRGGMAATMGALEGLRQTLPQAEISLTCNHFFADAAILRRLGQHQHVTVVELPWLKLHKSTLLTLGHSLPYMLKTLLSTLRRSQGNIFSDCDVILDLNIDSLHDKYGVSLPLFTLANLWLGRIARKPTVVWAAGIGDFNKWYTRLPARIVLNRVQMICAREGLTADYLPKIGVCKPEIIVTADHAFLLQAASPARVKDIFKMEKIGCEGKALVGISPSAQIPQYGLNGAISSAKRALYAGIMAETIDYIVNQMDADVVLIPHVISPTDDDDVLSHEIRRASRSAPRISVLTGTYSADELKGVIGACDLFIGCRMHATIAATSMGVPTIAVTYGRKSRGIIGDMMGQGAYIIEIEKYTAEQLALKLLETVQAAWKERDNIATVLKERSAAARNRALQNSALVKARFFPT